LAQAERVVQASKQTLDLAGFRTMACVWEVVGGEGRGGIQVCADDVLNDVFEAGSCGGKLATGSLIKELDRKSGRLQYELLKGCGPASGWVASSMLAKVHAGQRSSPENNEDSELLTDCGSGIDPEACRRLNEKTYLSNGPSEEEMEALRIYQEKFGEARDGSRQDWDRKAFPLFSPQGRSDEANPEAIDAAALTAEKKFQQEGAQATAERNR